jgi:benzoyl-CoA reductase/2-hydroxyglutaryl-CoA dehydratase subunit BcrC/BadD/HgdB
MRYEEQKIEKTQKESEQSIKILGAILTEAIKRIEILENTNKILVEQNMNLTTQIQMVGIYGDNDKKALIERIDSLEGKMMLIEDNGLRMKDDGK